jgi:N-succinyldiaminopimelate aminotransferase
MDVYAPIAGFYLWPKVDDDEAFTRGLFEQQHVMVLPGSYLSRATPQGDPGKGRLRISLVATVDECKDAAERIREFVES